MTTAEPSTAWRCSLCGEPVQLADARAHFDRCVDPDDTDEDDEEGT